MPLQIRRGTDAERQALIPSNGLVVGELLYVTDSQQVYIGTGNSGEHQGLAVTGYTNENAVDAVAAALTAGSNTGGISFVYGSAQDSANRIDARIDLSNYTGSIRADAFKGSVFGDDSTLLVNAIDGTFNGNLIGSVLTAAQPNITSVGTLTSLSVSGAINTNLIDSADSSAIVIASSAQFQSDVTVDNELNVSKIVIDGITHTSIGQELYPTPQTEEPIDHYLSFVDGVSGKTIVKTDGNLRYNPLTKVLTGTGFVGTNINAPTINSTNILTGTVNSNGVLLLYSNLTTSSLARVVAVGNDTVDGRFQVATGSYLGGLSLVNINQSHSTADALNFQFNRSRGTLGVQTAVQSGDDIVDIVFAGFDGTSLIPRAAITATVTGAVSAGVVPMKVSIATSVNGAGNPVDALVVNEKQQTTFSGAIKLAVYADATARDTAITAPTAGMMVFNTTSTKFQGYTGAAWVDLN